MTGIAMTVDQALALIRERIRNGEPLSPGQAKLLEKYASKHLAGSFGPARIGGPLATPPPKEYRDLESIRQDFGADFAAGMADVFPDLAKPK